MDFAFDHAGLRRKGPARTAASVLAWMIALGGADAAAQPTSPDQVPQDAVPAEPPADHAVISVDAEPDAPEAPAPEANPLESTALVAAVEISAPTATPLGAGVGAASETEATDIRPVEAVPEPAAPAPPSLAEASDIASVRETHALLVQRVEAAQRRQANVSPRLGGPIVATLFGAGLVAGSFVARSQVSELVCDGDQACERPVELSSWGLFGIGVGVTTLGVVKIVLHSVRRVRARRERTATEAQLERFERERLIDVDAAVAPTPSGPVGGLTVRISF